MHRGCTTFGEFTVFEYNEDVTEYWEGIEKPTPGIFGAMEQRLYQAQVEIFNKKEAEIKRLFPTDESLFEAKVSGVAFQVRTPLTLQIQMDGMVFKLFETGSFAYPEYNWTVEDDIYAELIRRNCNG